MIIIAAVGDIMPGGILSGEESSFVSQGITDELSKADIRVGTLESAIGDQPTFYEEKMKRKADVIYSRIGDINKLKSLSIDIVSLANNHFYDLGVERANECIKILDDAGIKHVGAGRNLKDASKPVVESLDGYSVAFLAFCDWRDETVGYCPFATDETPGVNPMFEEHVVSEIRKYKLLYDFIVVLPHWGTEHTWLTSQHVFNMAKIMRKAGADLILGSHPHRVQPVVNYRQGSVAYSMGNFFFPDRLIIEPRSTYYPEEDLDLDALPVTYSYPFVSEVTFKKWGPLARIGMIVLSSLDDQRCSSTYSLVQMSEKGYLSLLEDSSAIKRRLTIRGCLLRSSLYVIYYYLERYSNAAIRRILGLLKV